MCLNPSRERPDGLGVEELPEGLGTDAWLRVWFCRGLEGRTRPGSTCCLKFSHLALGAVKGTEGALSGVGVEDLDEIEVDVCGARSCPVLDRPRRVYELLVIAGLL